ncbi:hypothetical protein SELMODRAFT_441510 [Selaginella moellendorffii]|uniref:Uncharacterized protein n=1 Tax=Selaginella moellendorffii TaxID=88036 RepID=D8RK66_SELML|nr:hypothetical protein SELMODRAFT_441510 [Selaginella moellendorffii]
MEDRQETGYKLPELIHGSWLEGSFGVEGLMQTVRQGIDIYRAGINSSRETAYLHHVLLATSPSWKISKTRVRPATFDRHQAMLVNGKTGLLRATALAWECQVVRSYFNQREELTALAFVGETYVPGHAWTGRPLEEEDHAFLASTAPRILRAFDVQQRGEDEDRPLPRPLPRSRLLWVSLLVLLAAISAGGIAPLFRAPGIGFHTAGSARDGAAMALGFHFQAPPNSSIWMISPNAPVFYLPRILPSLLPIHHSIVIHEQEPELLGPRHRQGPPPLDASPHGAGSRAREEIKQKLQETVSTSKVLEKDLLELMAITGDPFLVLTRRSGGHDNVLRSVGIEPSPGVFSSKGLQATSCERTGNWSKKDEALVELRASMKGKKKENEYRSEAKSVFSSLGLKDDNFYASADDFLLDLSSAIEIMKTGLSIRPKQEKARCLLQNMILFQGKLECMTTLLNPRDARHELLDLAALQKSVQALREKLEKGKELLRDHVKRLLTNRWDLREWQ